MAEELLNAVFSGADEATARLRNIMTKEYSTEVDAMFGRLHENLAKNEEAKNYDADKYKRVGFSSRQDAVDFANYTQKNGVEATVAPVKLNGQYLVEIPENNIIPVYNEDSEASNTTEVSARQLIEKFEQENFVTVEQVNTYDPITPNSTAASELNALGNFILQNFDELGNAAVRVNSFVSMFDGYGSNANDLMFTQKLSATGEVQREAQHRAEFEASEAQRKRDFLSEGGREEDFKPKEYEPLQTKSANPQLKAGYSQTAQVINGDIVVIGGKEVHDEKVRQYVLDQYNERMEKAGRIVEKSEARLERYEEKEELRKARFDEKEELRREKFEFKEEQRLNSWEQTLSARGGAVSLQDESRFKPKEYKESTYKPHKAESVRQETMRKNAQSMLDGVYKQEVVAPDVAVRAGRNAGELDNIVAALNTDAIAMNATASFVLSNDERAAIGKLGMMTSLTNEEKNLIAKVSNSVFGVKDETLTIAERESLSNLITKYTAHQDESKYGRKIKTSDKSRQGRLRDAHESTLPTLGGLKEKIKLSDGEKMMFSTHSTSTLKNLEKDFNIKITKDNPLTRESLLQMNADLIKRGEKLGYQFVKAGGQFDTALLKKLSDRDLAKLGISKSSRDLLAGLNAKGAWGTRNFDIFKGAVGFGVKAVNKLAQDKDTSDLIRGGQKAYRYTTQTVTSVRQFSTAMKGKIDILKAKSVGRKDGLATAKVNKPKPQKNPKVRPVNEKRNAKYIKNQSKKLKKLQRSEKSIFTKARRLKDRIMKKIANNPLVKLVNKLKMKLLGAIKAAIPYILLGILILWGGLVVIVIAATIISSIADAVKAAIEFITPNYFDRSASWHLVTDLQKQEEKWIDTIEDFDDAYKNRADLKYGSEYMSFSEYLNSDYFEGRLIVDVNDRNKIYINPFHQAEGVVSLDYNEDALTGIDGFNGTQRVGFSANTSVYGEKEAVANRPSVSTESGHTSNIKDIVAMTDVMFQFDSDNADDGKIEDLIHESPAALDWKAFKARWSGFWHNVGTFFAKLFGGGEETDYIDINDAANGGTLSYRTLQGYATELFQVSHQRYYYLDVGYHDIVDEDFKVDGKELSTDVASEFGVCTTPVKNDFKIYFNGSEIVPCLETEGGSRYDLSIEGDYDITLTMDNFSGDEDTLCLWDGMGSNKETWERITGNTCWEMDSQQITPTERSYQSGWYDSESSAERAVSSYLESIYDSYAADPSRMGTEQYVLSGDKDSFSCVRYEMDNTFSVSYDRVYTREVPDGSYTDSEGNTTYYYRTQYMVTGTAKMYDQYKEQFSRHCKMHEFKYCGGHLNVTSQGVVFSMTNEQLALCGTYNKTDEYPTIIDYNYATYGYEKLVGKLFPKEVTFPNLIFDSNNQPIDTRDWGMPNAQWASTHGGSHGTPETSVQGSDTAIRGLNILVKENGTFDVGYGKPDLNAIHLVRDIFDADCMIDKGKNIFPTGSHYEKYEGWSEDNMTLALLRSTMDWASVYGIDTPIELDSPVLSTTDDIPKIINALKAHYGDAFNEEREEAVRTALTWVGRGHYSEDHKDHAFLTQICEAKDHPSAPCYDVNCTASDDEGFIAFILNRCANLALKDEETERKTQFIQSGGNADDFVAREYTNDLDILSSAAWQSYGSINDLLPADILKHDIGDTDSSNLPDGILSGDKKHWNEAVRAYCEERFVFYIGVIDEDIQISGSGSEIKIPAGSMLVVDLNVSENIGTIRLRTQTANSWGDVGSEKNYYWVTNPDSYTEVRKYN